MYNLTLNLNDNNNSERILFIINSYIEYKKNNKIDDDVPAIKGLCYILATIKHETAGTFLPIEEMGNRAYFDKYEPTTNIGKALGNTLRGDGYLFRGRGYIQLTGRANYTKLSSLLEMGKDKNLVTNPELALDRDLSIKIALLGMFKGVFTGKNLLNYINMKNWDYLRARAIINGNDKAELIASYAKDIENDLVNFIQFV